jgi:endonuclease III related protein
MPRTALPLRTGAVKLRMGKTELRRLLQDIYHRLFARYGPQQWWPGDTPFEVMVGAILTQSASWHNVEIAIVNLKASEKLSPQVLREIPIAELGRLIHSCGYFNAKSKKLKALSEWLGEYEDNLERAFAGGLNAKRDELLGIHGIGPETADSILLYAAGKAVFVIDAYTRRIVERMGIPPQTRHDDYDMYQRLFTSNLEQKVPLFDEYHALLVKLGKDVCRQKPLCLSCCVGSLCEYYRVHSLNGIGRPSVNPRLTVTDIAV